MRRRLRVLRVKPLRIYIASSFDEVVLCEAVCQQMRASGHTVPDVWWNTRTKDSLVGVSDLEFYGSPLIQSIAARHWETIREVDAVIIVSSMKHERSFTGANVEIGFAHGLNKPIFSLGKLKRSAMYCPIIKCGNMADLISSINCLAQESR